MKLPQLVLLATAASAAPHYTFPKIVGTQDWQVVRMAANHNSNGPVTDVTSQDIRCYQQTRGGGGSTTTYSAKAGGSISWGASPNIFHPGAMSAYMAKVPAGQTAVSFDGAGAVWFKIYQEMPTIAGSGMSWASQNKGSFSFQLPSCLANGDYLFRIEHVALHQSGKPQFYISCAQLSVSGGSGSKAPTDLVSFPGAYKLSDPGLALNIYSAKQFTPAGPPIFKFVSIREDEISSNYPVKRVLLAGGFGNNWYLLKQLQDTCMVLDEDIKVTVIHNGPLEGLNTRVVSRLAGKHYGTQCYVPYDPSMHPAHLKEPDPSGSGYRVYANQWWVKKNEIIKDGISQAFFFSYTGETAKGLPSNFPCKIIVCNAHEAPLYAKQGQDIQEFVTIHVPLDRTHEVNKKTDIRHGVSLTTVDFVVEMRLLPATVDFTLVLGAHQPQRIGQVRVDLS